MRLYTFNNMYLSSIQIGIQTAHCVSDMFVKYTATNTPALNMLTDWAEKHKTIIVLNGGNCADLQELTHTIRELGLKLGLPFDWFNEDEESLNGALTCVGVIVPAKIYEYAAKAREMHCLGTLAGALLGAAHELSQDEISIAELISNAPLAR